MVIDKNHFYDVEKNMQKQQFSMHKQKIKQVMCGNNDNCARVLAVVSRHIAHCEFGC